MAELATRDAHLLTHDFNLLKPFIVGRQQRHDLLAHWEEK